MFGMLNEGGVYKDIYTLRDFFKQKKLFMSLLNSDPHLMHHSFMNILFQIIYTLHIFKKINFKHNDLHTSNIMILINEFNIIGI